MTDLSDISSLLESYSPSSELSLDMIFPYIRGLSSCMAEKSTFLDADECAYAYLDSFIKKSQIKIGFIDGDNRLKAVSPAFEHWVHEKSQSNQSLVSKTLSEVWQIESLPLKIKESLEKNRKGIADKQEEIHLLLGKKEKRWVKWESFPWIKINNEVGGTLFYLEDITEQKELFIEICKLYARTELLERCALIFSHDLIQPLRQISTYTSFLKEDLIESAALNPSIQETIESLNRCVLTAQKICEGVVTYCKNGDLTINKEPMEITEIIELIRQCFPHKLDVTIQDLTPKNLVIGMNKACLLQLFQNLVDNAIKHSLVSPIHITLSGEYTKNGYYYFNIHNEGWCGEALNQKNAFDPFYSNNKNGAGLGLMICKKIVNAYGGEIAFNSTLEKGTHVSFSLPLFQEKR